MFDFPIPRYLNTVEDPSDPDRQRESEQAT